MTTRALLLRVTLLCLTVRAVLEAAGFASLAAKGETPWPQWLGMWSRWDAPHYLRLAEIGYVNHPSPNQSDPLNIVFFPGYPAAIHAAAWVVRDTLAAGLLVSLIASIAAGFLLYRLTALDHGDRIAWWAVVLLYAAPTAYFLAAPFTEALYLAAVLASVYAARVCRWPLVGIMGALATATRMTGVALGLPLLLTALRAPACWRKRTGRLAWCAVAAAGLMVYLGINWRLYGNPLYFTIPERTNWGNTVAWPWEFSRTAATTLLAGKAGGFTFIYASVVASAAIAVTLLTVGTWKLRAEHSLYGWAAFIVMVSASWSISLGRYLLAIYPLFMVGAVLCRRRWVLWPVLVASAGVQGWLMWRYAAGQWTF